MKTSEPISGEGRPVIMEKGGENRYVIHQGGRCSNACITCRRTDFSPMPIEQIESEILAAKEQRADSVFFADRELVAHPSLRKILELLKFHNMPFGLSTNARAFVHRRIFDFLLPAGFSYARVKLHAGSFYPHFLITEREGFHQAIEGMKALKSRGIAFEIVVDVNQFNKGSLKRVEMLGKRLGVADLISYRCDTPSVFEKEIEEALQYRQQMAGRIMPMTAQLNFKKTEEIQTLDLARCPLKSATKSADSEYALMLEIGENRYQTYRLDGKSDALLLFQTKIAYETIFSFGKEKRRARLKKECVNCTQLADCPACFSLEDLPPRERDAPEEKVATPDKMLDLEEATDADPIERLIEIARSLQAGERLLVMGRVPVIVLNADETKDSVTRADIGLLADFAETERLKPVDYTLPGGEENPMAYRILFEKQAKQTEEKNERTAVLAVQSACVADCVMCSMPKSYKGRRLSTPAIARLLEEVKLSGFSAVDIFGGEVTLRADLPLLIRLVKRLNLYSMIISTGFNIDENYLETLVDSGLDKIEIALDAPNEALHDKIKGRVGLFRHGVRAIRAASAHPKLYVEVNSVILQDNVSELLKLHRFVAEELGGFRHRMFYYVQVLTPLNEPRLLTRAQAERWVYEQYSELMEYARKNRTKIDFCPPISGEIYSGGDAEWVRRLVAGNYEDLRRCAAPQRDLMVMPDGDIYACISPSVATGREPIGMIGEIKILDALSSEAMQHWIERAGFWPECKSCISRR